MEIPEIVRFDIFDIYVHLGSGVLLIGVALFINEGLLEHIAGLNTVFQLYIIFVAYLFGIMIFPLSITLESILAKVRQKYKKEYIPRIDKFEDQLQEKRQVPQRIHSMFGGHPIEAKWIENIAQHLETGILPGFKQAEDNFQVGSDLERAYKTDELDRVIKYLENNQRPMNADQAQRDVEMVNDLYFRSDFLFISDEGKVEVIEILSKDVVTFVLKNDRDIVADKITRHKYAILADKMQLELSSEGSIGTYSKHLARSYLLLTTSVIFVGAAIVLFSITAAYVISDIALRARFEFPPFLQDFWLTHGYGSRGAAAQALIFLLGAGLAYYLRREEYYSYINALANDYQRLQKQ